MSFIKRPGEDRRAFFVLLFPAILLLLLAAALIALAAVRVKAISLKLFLLVLAACLATFAVVMILFFRTVTGRAKPLPGKKALPRQGVRHNVFLYRQETDSDVAPEELTPEMISFRMMVIISFFAKRKKLDLFAMLDDSARGALPPVMRPVCIYALLYNLSDADNDYQWQSFLTCGKPLADAVAKVLPPQDEEWTRRLQRGVALYAADGDVTDFKTSVKSHKEALGERMVQYVREHIHEFD